MAVDRLKRRTVIPLNSSLDFQVLDFNPAEDAPSPHLANAPSDGKTMSLNHIISNYKLPITVRVAQGKGIMASSGFAMNLTHVETHENLYGGSAEMCDLLSIPLTAQCRVQS